MGDKNRFYPDDYATSPDLVIHAADGNYKSVLMLGYNQEGNLDVRASTNINAVEALWMIEKFKRNLLNGLYASPK